MSGLGGNVFINPERAFWLREVPPDVSHSTITVQELDASIARISTATIEDLTVSSAQFSTFGVQNLDVSGMYVSSLRGNTGFFSSMSFASDLSGGVGYVRFSVDASGIQVDGDPIRFDNLVYLTSTINIIQVSTLVDTDIFAQRGFFSTLSSGNLFASKAYISSLEVTDLSGFSERNWSLYPTLSGEIIMSTGYNLSNVGSNLFFAGQQLATPADISGIDTWSYHPAISSLKMNNQVITGLSTINFQDGATLTSQTGNNLFYNGQAVQYGATSNVSQWANYPAVTTVQLSNNGITATGSIPIAATSNVSITAQRISTVADQGLLNVASYADINLTAQNGLKGRINMTANPGAAGLFGEINMTANGGTVAGVGTGGLVTITANTPLGTLCNATSAIKFSASGINSYAGAIPSVGSLAGYNFIYGTGGVNICAGIPSVFPNTPLTTFLYGTAGVVSGSDFYVPNIYPYWNGLTTPPDLLISGRYIIPNLAQVYVQLSNVRNIYMDGGAQILNARYVSTVSTVGQNANFNTGTFGTLVAGAVGASAGLFTTLEAGSISSSLVTAPTVSSINVNLSTINGIPFTSVVTPEDIVCSTITVGASTITNTLRANYAEVSTLFYNFGLAASTTIGALQVNNIKVADDITGVTNAPMPLQSRLLNFSTVNSFNVSTTDLWVSSINGQAVDVSGGGGGGTTSSFQIIYTSTLSGYGGFPIEITSPLFFSGPDAINNLTVINTSPDTVPLLQIGASTISLNANNVLTNSLSTTRLQASTFKTVDLSANTLQYVAGSGSNLRISSLSGYGGFGIKVGAPLLFSGPDAIDNVVVINLNPLSVPALDIGASTILLTANNVLTTSLSTVNLGADYIRTSTITANPPYTGEIFFDGQLRPLNNIIVLYNNNIVFQDSTGASQFLTAQQLVNQEFPCFINPGGGFGSNLGSVGANAFYAGSGTGAFGGAKFYSDFPSDNFGIDIIDANGTDLFEAIYCYDTGGFNFQTGIAGVSSITGFTAIGGSGPATGFENIVTAPTISTQNLLVSSINGAPVDGSSFDNQFSTLFVSSLNFSTAFSYGSNTGTTYPIFIEKDHAGGATGGDAVAIAVQGHNLGTGAVRNQIEMGARGSGENYIMSVWPGQNLEELFIDATDLTVRDGIFSTIINLDPYGLRTNGIILGPQMSTLALQCSTINGNDANPAYLNALMTSSMTLYSGSTTLMSLDSRTAFSNINISGYDAVVGVNGTYKIGTSFQFLSAGSADEVEFFVLKNNVPISYGGGICSVQNNEEIIQYCEIVEPLNNGDAIQIGCFTNGTNVLVSTIVGTAIQSPAMILTMYKID